MAVMTELGLSFQQSMALMRLEPDEPLPMSALAASLQCDNSNVTGIVDRMDAVGLARSQLGQRGLLERLGDVEPRRAGLARRAPQHRRTRVLGAVDPVAEPHKSLALVERALHPGLGVALALDLVEHLQHASG